MRLSLLLLATGLVCALPAHADDIFTINQGGNNVSFALSSTVIPNLANSMAFQLSGVGVDVNGAILSNETVDFYTAGDEGGLAILGMNPFIMNLAGTQLFTGSTADPTFALGQYSLFSLGDRSDDGTMELGITAAAGVAPEPSSFFLLGTGLLGVAGTLRRRLA